MNKRLVDIGLKKLEICKQGEGQPVVVIELGMGSSMDEWSHIVDEISQDTTVLIYHRAGYGISTIDSNDDRRTENIVEDLNTLLDKEDISEKIIIVGHSFGGFCGQHYLTKYPDRIKGLILIDSTPLENYKIEKLKKQLKVINTKYNINNMIEKWNELSMKTDEKLKDEVSHQIFNNKLDNLSEKEQSKLEFLSKPTLYKVMRNEFNNLFESRKKSLEIENQLNIPLKVLVRDGNLEIDNLVNNGIPVEEATRLEDLVQELLKEQVNISMRGEIIEAKGCRHNIYIDNPKLVVNTIRSVINEVAER
ncbi:alpha/beta fold hydrolase [Clostridium sp. D2Q-11]|uniref:Alpha/beta fold hydrolase n=1 Tax=Anaeromonas frigoriresistens TaxID=2683708 RepID=A0A942Z876_9FIRM|nr:alpha/beta hydrolase [Anaeromonas frigoriresistens]MBS4537650.1 alpha/beta fold hydrolase [Anaeromonas frigoriresistens]